MSDYQHEMEVALAAVRQASRVCAAIQAEITPDTLAKQDKSPVTVADYSSQALICRAIRQSFPLDPIIAEEDAGELRQPAQAGFLDKICSHLAAAGVPATADAICGWIDLGGANDFQSRFWTLDPIDGTKGFLRGEQYAVSLALIVNGEIVLGVLGCPNLPVTANQFKIRREGEAPAEPKTTDRSESAGGPIGGPPANSELRLDPGSAGASPSHPETNGLNSKGTLFHAVKGQGSFMQPLDGPALPTRIQVSAAVDRAALRFCESVESGHSKQDTAAIIAQRLGITTAPARMDSQAKYGVVARGEAHIYLRLPTRADYREKIWDHAGGVLVVTEAGGTVTDVNGKPLDFTHGRELTENRGVIATTGNIHQEVVEAYAAAINEST